MYLPREGGMVSKSVWKSVFLCAWKNSLVDCLLARAPALASLELRVSTSLRNGSTVEMACDFNCIEMI